MPGPVTDPRNDPVFEVVGICHTCTHRRTLNTCSAFPHGIPKEILVGDYNHTKPYPNDNGIRYEKRLV